MFWRFNYHSSEIDTLLDKEDVTLVEIISEEDVLQECKAQNTKLIDFLTKPENMKNLLSMVINEPSKEIEEKLRYKLPNSSCELLTSDITAITDSLMSTESLLNELLGFLDQEEVLNPLQASFFSKIMGLLIMRKSQEFLVFLKSRSTFMDRLLHHLNTSAIMDLLLRLVISMDSPQSRTECLEWLKEQKLVERLIDLIRSKHSPETNYNASFSLCDLIRHGKDQLSFEQDTTSVGDVLLKVIQSEESIKSLLNSMFEDPTVESSIIGGLSILHTLLEFKKANLESPFESSTSSLPDVDKFMASIDGTLKALLPRLKDFHRILTHPPKQHYCPMQTTAGLLDVPLGNARLNVVRLITYLMVLNYKPINEELIRLGTMGVLLDLFFEYSWNNFLHTQFEHIINNILTNAITSVGSSSIALGKSTSTSPAITVTTASAASATAAESNANSNASSCVATADSATMLINQLMIEFKLLNRIVEAFELNDDRMKVPSHRLGYIGHLTKISNSLLNSCNAPLLDGILLRLDQSDVERWKDFTTTALAEVNKQNSLDGTVGSTSSVMSAVDDDFRMDFQIDSEHKFGCTEDEGLDFEAALSDSNSWANLSPTSLANSQKKASLFEEMCESRADDFNDDAVVIADDVDDADDVTTSAAATAAANDNSQSDEDIWKEKLANFPESLLKPEVSKSVKTHTTTEKKKKVDNDGDENDEDNDDDDSDEDGDAGPGSSCDKSKNDEEDVEEMDVSSNDCWANFEEGQLDEGTAPVSGRSPWSSSNPPSVVFDDSNNAMTGWADFETAQDTTATPTTTNSTSDEGVTNVNSINVFASIVKESGTDSLEKANQASAVDPPSFSNGPA